MLICCVWIPWLCASWQNCSTLVLSVQRKSCTKFCVMFGCYAKLCFQTNAYLFSLFLISAWGIVLSFVLVFLISLNIVWSYFGEDLLGRPFRRRPCYCVNIPGCFRQKTKPSAFVKVVGSHLAAETYPLKSHGSSKSFVFHRTTQCFCNRLSFLTAGKSQVELMTLMTHDSVPINVLVNRDPAATYVIAGPPINGMQTSLIHLFLSSHGKSKCLLVGGSI